MKKLLFILVVILFSCEKTDKDDPVFCWNCELITTYSATHYKTKFISDISVKCNQTEDQIMEYMKDESSLVVIKIGQTTATTEKVCICKKKI